jgi:hypothetical protein
VRSLYRDILLDTKVFKHLCFVLHVKEKENKIEI